MATFAADDPAARRRAILRWSFAVAVCLILATLYISHPFFWAWRTLNRADHVISVLNRQLNLANAGQFRKSQQLGDAENIDDEIGTLLDPASHLTQEYRERIVKLRVLHALLMMPDACAAPDSRMEANAATPSKGEGRETK